MKEASYYSVSGDVVTCELCPRYCQIKDRKTGSCGVRQNIGGKLHSLYYGKPCSVHIDPIEKKPLYHVLPGSRALSIATVGCNLFCSFCQNWQISKSGSQSGMGVYELSPEKVVSTCLQDNCRNISFTYTEPTIFYEYMIDIARPAKAAGIKNNIVSNGYINEKPLRELCECIDAANIDLKSFDEAFYREMCRAELAPVLQSLKVLKEEGVWVEVTNLMIPEKNDDMKLVEEMCKWIANELGRETPMHFSRFHPDYQYTSSYPTPVKTLQEAEGIAQKYLDYVYLGNVGYENDTLCPGCKKTLIKRQFFGVSDVKIKNDKCPHCQADIAGIWE